LAKILVGKESNVHFMNVHHVNIATKKNPECQEKFYKVEIPVHGIATLGIATPSN